MTSDQKAELQKRTRELAPEWGLNDGKRRALAQMIIEAAGRIEIELSTYESSLNDPIYKSSTGALAQATAKLTLLLVAR